MAADRLIHCTNCKSTLPTNIGSLEAVGCPSCGKELDLHVFPAFFRQLTAAREQKLSLDGESDCYVHSGKKAEHVCDMCGRFMCALCDLELDGQHLCPSCLNSGREKGKLEKLKRDVMRYDHLALTISLVMIFLWYFAVFISPYIWYLSIRHWNKKESPVQQWTRLRFSIASLIALLAFAGSLFLWGTVFFGNSF